MKKLYLLIFFLVFSSYLFSQTDSEQKKEYLLTMAKNAGLKSEKVAKIKELIEIRDKKIVQHNENWTKNDMKYVIDFYDYPTSKEAAQQEFRKNLAKELTLKEFGKVFFEQLGARIERDAKEKLHKAKDRYLLTSIQEKELYKIIYDNIYNEVVTREFYNYDNELAYYKHKDAEDQSKREYNEALKSFGLLISENEKTDAFIKKAKEVGIDNSKIEKILEAIVRRDEKIAARNKKWSENDVKYLIYFHDEGTTEHAIKMDLRREITNILNIDEFKAIFLEQIQDRIDREVYNDFDKIRNAYQLKNKQLIEVKKFLNEKITAKSITDEYYKYSWDLSQQKLRAVEYRYEKAFRDMIKKFKAENSKEIVESSK